MIDETGAIALVEAELNAFDPDWPTRPKRTVETTLTVEKDWGWVLFYGVPEDFQTGQPGELPEENPPYLVNRRTGRLEVTGTEHELAWYLERYEHRL